MAKYVLVYQGGQMAETPDAQEAAMAAWGAWFGSLGDAAVDWGAPFGASASVGGGAATTELSGYSIVQADDLAAALAIGDGCPIIADGGRVDVYETIELGCSDHHDRGTDQQRHGHTGGPVATQDATSQL